MPYFKFKLSDSFYTEAQNIAVGKKEKKNGFFNKNALTDSSDKTMLSYLIVSHHPTYDGLESIQIDVPFDAVIKFSKAIMQSKQIEPLDLSEAGQVIMKNAYEAGPESFGSFMRQYCPE